MSPGGAHRAVQAGAPPPGQDVARAVLRPWREEDLPALVALAAACFDHPWTLGAWEDSWRAGHRGEVLVDPQGHVLAYSVALRGVDEVQLLDLAVAPAAQRQGWAKILLEALMAQAQDWACEQVLLEVRAGNVRAQQIYARAGFQTVGRRKGYYPAAQGREDAWVMVAPVVAAPPTQECP